MMSDNLKNGSYACWWWFFAQHSFVFPNWNSISQGCMSHEAQQTQDSAWADISSDNPTYANVHKDLSSLITGPSCWLRLYSEEGCTGHVLSIGPNSAISDLSQFDMDGGDWNNQAKSFRVYYREPDDGWSESTPKDGALKQRYAADKKQDSAWSLIREIIQVGVLAIPVVGEAADASVTVGNFLANAFITLWPSGSADDRLIQGTKAWVLMQTYKLYAIDQDIFTTTSLSDLRDAFYNTVSWNTDGTPKKDDNGNVIYSTQKVEILLTQINACINEINAGGPEYWQLSSIHYTAIVAAIAAFTWRVSLRIEFDPDSNAPNWCRSGLEDQLPKLIGYMRDALDQAQQLRTGFVKNGEETVRLLLASTTYEYWKDEYAGYSSGYFDPVSEGGSGAKVHSDYYIDQVLTPNLVNDWDMVRQLADALEYWADTSFAVGGDDADLPRTWVRSKTGLYGDIRADTDTFPIKYVEWYLDDEDQVAFNETNLSDDGDYDDKDMWLGFTVWSKVPIADEPGAYTATELPSLGYVDELAWGATISIGSVQHIAGTVGTRGADRNCIGSCVAIQTNDDGETGTVYMLGGKSEHMPYGWSVSPPDGSNGRWCGVYAQQNPAAGGRITDYWAIGDGTEYLRPNAIRNIGFLWRFVRVIPKGTSPTSNMWLEDLVKL